VSSKVRTNAQDDLAQITKAEIERNKLVREVSATVEHYFAIMEKKFTIFSKKFADGSRQLDYLVTFAAGVLSVLNDK